MLGLVGKKGVVDQIAQHVLLTVGEEFVGVVGILLLDLIAELILAANVFRAGDDLVVDAHDDFFDDLSGRESGQTCRSYKNQAKFLHKIPVGRRASWAYGQKAGCRPINHFTPFGPRSGVVVNWFDAGRRGGVGRLPDTDQSKGGTVVAQGRSRTELS